MEDWKDYVVYLDSKKQVTLRGAEYPHDPVKEYGSRYMLLEPYEQTVPESISAKLWKIWTEQ